MPTEDIQRQGEGLIEVALQLPAHRGGQRQERRRGRGRADRQKGHAPQPEAEIALQHEHGCGVQIAVVGAAGAAARLTEQQDLSCAPGEMRRATLLQHPPRRVDVEPPQSRLASVLAEPESLDHANAERSHDHGVPGLVDRGAAAHPGREGAMVRCQRRAQILGYQRAPLPSGDASC